MKPNYTTMNRLLFILLILVQFSMACTSEPASDGGDEKSEGEQLFEKNSQTVREYLEAFQAGDINYDRFFTKDYMTWGTAFGQTDTTYLEEMVASDRQFFDSMEARLTTDPLNLLPGVNIESKELDGSVRYYGDWLITTRATDSTESKSGQLRMYQAFVFNDNGKIRMILSYGDFSGLMRHLWPDM